MAWSAYPFFLNYFPLTICLGVSSSNITHLLWPTREVFHAHVIEGSICTVEPERSGPIKNLGFLVITIGKEVYLCHPTEQIHPQ